jgi:hypothetical protein
MRQQVEAKLRRGATIREHDSDGKCRIEIPVPAKPSKYGNERCVVDGLHFRSLKEVRRYRELRILEAAGQIKDLRREVPFELRVNGRTICVYVADFVYYVTGRMVMHPTIEDVKGMRKGIAYRLFKIKVALMHAIHGHVVVEI